jgi:hypothetical protein
LEPLKKRWKHRRTGETGVQPGEHALMGTKLTVRCAGAAMTISAKQSSRVLFQQILLSSGVATESRIFSGTDVF